MCVCVSRLSTLVHMSYAQRTSNPVMRGSGVGGAASSLIDRTKITGFVSCEIFSYGCIVFYWGCVNRGINSSTDMGVGTLF